MMRKVLIQVLGVILTLSLIVALTYLRVSLGEPKLRIELFPPPPWHMSAVEPFEVSIGVVNDGWLLAWARDVRVSVSMPEGFISSRTGTNECELNFFALHGGDGLGNGLTIIASNNVLAGNYTITIQLYAENVPEEMFNPLIIVPAP